MWRARSADAHTRLNSINIKLYIRMKRNGALLLLHLCQAHSVGAC